MKSSWKVEILPNSIQAYLAEPVFDDEIPYPLPGISGVELTPIIAWRVEYDQNYEGSLITHATPVTPLPYSDNSGRGTAIWYPETETWNHTSFGRYGKGKDSLIKSFITEWKRHEQAESHNNHKA